MSSTRSAHMAPEASGDWAGLCRRFVALGDEEVLFAAVLVATAQRLSPVASTLAMYVFLSRRRDWSMRGQENVSLAASLLRRIRLNRLAHLMDRSRKLPWLVCARFRKAVRRACRHARVDSTGATTLELLAEHFEAMALFHTRWMVTADQPGVFERTLPALERMTALSRSLRDLGCLAWALLQRGVILFTQKRLELAEPILKRAVRMYRRLAFTAPEDYAVKLPLALITLSDVYRDREEHTRALGLSAEAQTTMESLPRSAFIEYARHYLRAGINSAIILVRSGLLLPALAVLDRTDERICATQGAKELLPLDLVAEFLTLKGNLLFVTGRSIEAIQIHEQAVATLRHLVEKNAQAYRPNLALALTKFAGSLLSSKDQEHKKAALAMIDEAVDYYEEYFDAHPETYAIEYSSALVLSALARGELGESAAALVPLRKAEQVIGRFAWAFAWHAGVLLELGRTLERLGQTGEECFRRAIRVLEDGVATAEPATKSALKARIELAYHKIITALAHGCLAAGSASAFGDLLSALESLRNAEALLEAGRASKARHTEPTPVNPPVSGDGAPSRLVDQPPIVGQETFPADRSVPEGANAAYRWSVSTLESVLGDWGSLIPKLRETQSAFLYVHALPEPEGILFVALTARTALIATGDYRTRRAGQRLARSTLRSVERIAKLEMQHNVERVRNADRRCKKVLWGRGRALYAELPAEVREILASSDVRVILLSCCAVTGNWPWEMLVALSVLWPTCLWTIGSGSL